MAGVRPVERRRRPVRQAEGGNRVQWVRRVVDFLLTAALGVVTYAIVGAEFHTWRGALLLGLLVLGTVALLAAAYKLGDVGWTWRAGLHGLLGGAAVVAGVVLSGSWRWPLAAAITICTVLVRRHLFPTSNEEDATDRARSVP